jgi:hypothetical protein
MDLKAEKKTLRGLLAVDEQQFRIPPYQRPYSWTTEQIDDLWQDLTDDLTTGHFLGSLVLSSEDELRPQVIDGQQRLTTLMMLLAALRDACHARGLDKEVQRIDKRLTADDMADGDAQFKFKTSSVNWPVFRDFVLRGPTDPGRKADASHLDKDLRARNRPLFDNLARIQMLLASNLSPLSEVDQSTRLKDLIKCLVEKVEFVVIEVTNLGDAFLLFETLNDRGLQLSAADLLKSHLLGEIARSESEEDVDAASTEWDGLLEKLGAHVDVSRFLRHYLLGTRANVKKDDIFGIFKVQVKEIGARQVLEDLRAAASRYGDFEAPDRVTHEPTRRVLKDLQTLRAMSCYIALLPARQFLSESDFLDFARLAEIVTYRYSSVAGLGTNDIERKYHEAAKLLHDSRGERLRDARALLIGAMPDSEQFQAAFSRMTLGRQYLLKYTLQKLEEARPKSLGVEKEKELKTTGLVHIEHIMPQKLSQSWLESLGPEAARHDELLNRWGNLTLLYWDLNLPASNNSFEVKKEYYAQSDVELTKDLCDVRAWGPDEILERQRNLGAAADALWAVPNLGLPPTDVVSDDVLVKFVAGLADLWPAVEPFVAEADPEEIKALAERLPGHLNDHPHNEAKAQRIRDDLLRLLETWESLNGAERSVVKAATMYFLEVNDVVPDDAEDGLNDDERVLAAALEAVSRRLHEGDTTS